MNTNNRKDGQFVNRKTRTIPEAQWAACPAITIGHHNAIVGLIMVVTAMHIPIYFKECSDDLSVIVVRA